MTIVTGTPTGILIRPRGRLTQAEIMTTITAEATMEAVEAEVEAPEARDTKAAGLGMYIIPDLLMTYS